ncbi:MAG: hypothetical protein BWY71_02169 [Planctomycetes bacterium ADurb.Bin412]|nr:MAG: hypothetical protein BWY71_02169 [Planctomycetes bacterium ADurb.Bin412]
MHQQLPHPAPYQVRFKLGGIMGHIIHLMHAQLGGIFAENLGKNLPNPMQNDLPVGKGHIDGAIHGGKVILSLLRREGSAGQFAVGHGQAIFTAHRSQKRLQIIGGDLVAETPAAAVEHDHDLMVPVDAEGSGGIRVEDIFLFGDLDFQVMIAGTQGPNLFKTPVNGLGTNLGRIGPRHTAAGLGPLQIFQPAILVINGPSRAPAGHFAKFLPGNFDKSSRPDAGRDPLKQTVNQPGQMGPDFLQRQIGADQAHAAIDVKADSARRNHPLLGIDSSHPPYRKTVAPVAVGHAKRMTHNAGQSGNIGHLLKHPIVHLFQ